MYDLCKQTTNVDIRHRMVKSDNNYVNVLFDWENSSKAEYYNLTIIELNGLCNLFLNSDLKALKSVRPDIFSQNGLNDIYRNVVHVLYNASLKTIMGRSKKVHNKYWWDQSLNEEKINSKKHFDNWCNAGKPNCGSIYNDKCAARKKYRCAIFKKRSDSKNHVGEKLQKNLINSNSKNFWKCWNGCFKKSKCTQSLNVNGLREDSDIANYLAEEFERTCTPHDVRKH